VATSGGERFAIPQVSLLELVRLEAGQIQGGIEMMYGAPVYRLRGKLLPLVYLSRALKLDTVISAIGEAESATNIVVLQADDRQFGLVVDEINDTEEIVVKPLGKQFKSSSCFAGATIMGDGKVALILDVLGIAQMANVVTEVRERSVVDTSTRQTDAVAGRDAWLVFAVGENRRVAIPLSMVSRLEEFAAELVERAGRHLVVQYRGQIMPLVDVAEELGLGSRDPAKQTLQVVVYTEAGKSVGLIVDRIIDIVEQGVVLGSGEQAGETIGSAVIQERVTDLLNVHGLVAAHTLRPAESMEAR
jgi:two-component system, chemotaxis family, sensor kinase CheA